MDPMDLHRRDFMKFVDDCAVYCLEKSNGVVYVPLEPLEGSRTHFSNDYGDAVLQYNGADDEMYRKRIRKTVLNEFLTPEGLRQYIHEGMDFCFPAGRKITEGIFKFCSLYIDTAIFCFRYQRSDLIYTFLVSTVSPVFENKIQRLFKSNSSAIHEIWDKIVEEGLAFVEREKMEGRPQ